MPASHKMTTARQPRRQAACAVSEVLRMAKWTLRPRAGRTARTRMGGAWRLLECRGDRCRAPRRDPGPAARGTQALTRRKGAGSHPRWRDRFATLTVLAVLQEPFDRWPGVEGARVSANAEHEFGGVRQRQTTIRGGVEHDRLFEQVQACEL